MAPELYWGVGGVKQNWILGYRQQSPEHWRESVSVKEKKQNNSWWPKHQSPPEWDERQWHGQDERPRDWVAEKAHNRQAHIYSLGGQVEQNQGSHRAQWRSIVRHTRNTVYRRKSSDWTWRFLKCRLSSKTKHHTAGTTKLPVDCS